MNKDVTTTAVDLAKNIFQVAYVDGKLLTKLNVPKLQMSFLRGPTLNFS